MNKYSKTYKACPVCGGPVRWHLISDASVKGSVRRYYCTDWNRCHWVEWIHMALGTQTTAVISKQANMFEAKP